jgi:hypothetical protein
LNSNVQELLAIEIKVVFTVTDNNRIPSRAPKIKTGCITKEDKMEKDGRYTKERSNRISKDIRAVFTGGERRVEMALSG